MLEPDDDAFDHEFSDAEPDDSESVTGDEHDGRDATKDDAPDFLNLSSLSPSAPAAVPVPAPAPTPTEPAESAQYAEYAEPPIPAAPALRPVAPPAISAVSRPSVDDPELTALAAALFGPRAQTPSHPRRVDDDEG